MTDQDTQRDVADLLTRAADGVRTGAPAPDLIQRGRRARRRRSAMTLAGAAAVCAVVAGVAFGVQHWALGQQVGPTSGEVALQPGPQMQVKGIGGVHIALPAMWERGAISYCASREARRSVWRLDGDAVPLCAGPFPDDSTEVTLGLVEKGVVLNRVGEDVPVPGGGDGFRSPTACAPDRFAVELAVREPVEVCSATLWVSAGDREAFVSVRSSRGVEHVDALLDRVHIGESVGVPQHVGSADDDYLDLLEELGLRARVVEAKRSTTLTPTVTRVDPEAGTVVERGSTVTVEVSLGQTRDEGDR